MRKNICYHTRLHSNQNVKTTGGTFGGSIDQETVERLTRLFSVRVKPSGHVVFVDRDDREVSLYISVDAADTEKGKAALKEWRAERARVQALQEATYAAQVEIVEGLIDSLGYDEVIRRLGRG